MAVFKVTIGREFQREQMKRMNWWIEADDQEKRTEIFLVSERPWWKN